MSKNDKGHDKKSPKAKSVLSNRNRRRSGGPKTTQDSADFRSAQAPRGAKTIADLHDSFSNTEIQAALAGKTGGRLDEIRARMSMMVEGVESTPSQSEYRDAVSSGEFGMNQAEALGRLRSASGGQKLPGAMTGAFEAATGADVSHSRVILGFEQELAAIGAKAVAIGDHIVMGSADYDPNSREGRELLAHELDHVRQGQEGALGGIEGPSTPDMAPEQEAVETGRAVAQQFGSLASEAASTPSQGAQIEALDTVVQQMAQVFTAAATSMDLGSVSVDAPGIGAPIEASGPAMGVVDGGPAMGLESTGGEAAGAEGGSAAVMLSPADVDTSVLEERLAEQKGRWDDNEDGIFMLLNNATPDEISSLKERGVLETWLGELHSDQRAKIEQKLEDAPDAAISLLEQQWSGDPMEGIKQVLVLSPQERAEVWAEIEGESEGSEYARHMRLICVGTRKQATDAALAFATRFGSREDVAFVVRHAANQAEMVRGLKAKLASGELTPEERVAVDGALADLGDVSDLMAEGDVFLKSSEDNLGAGVAGMLEQTKGDPLQIAKVRIRNAATPSQMLAALARLDETDRDELLDDKPTAALLSGRGGPGLELAKRTSTANTFPATRLELQELCGHFNVDAGKLLQRIAQMPEGERTKLRADGGMLNELKNIRFFGEDAGWASNVDHVIANGSLPVDAMMDSAASESMPEFAQDALAGLSPEDRALVQRGYLLVKNGTAAELDKQAEEDGECADSPDHRAIERYRELMGKGDAVSSQGSLDRDKITGAMVGQMDPAKLGSPEGRMELADTWMYRQKERVEFASNVGTSADQTVVVAHQLYMDAYTAAKENAEANGLSEQQIVQLTTLDQQFWESARGQEASNKATAEIAASIAAAVVCVGLVALTGGVGAAVIGPFFTTLGGTSVLAIGAVTAGATKVAVAEGVGGDFNDVEDEGAKQFASGAVEMVATLAGAKLATGIIGAVGKNGAKAGQIMGKASGEAAKAGARTSVGTAVLEGAVDGLVGGALGELTMTALDAETYKGNLWKVIGRYGAAIRDGAFIGALGGGVVSGGLGTLGKVVEQFGDAKAAMVRRFMSANQLDEAAVEAVEPSALVRGAELIQKGSVEEGMEVLRRGGLVEGALDVSDLRKKAALLAAADDMEGGSELILNLKIKDNVPDADFEKLAGTPDGSAVLRFDGDTPILYVREGADPSIMREELVHLSQWNNNTVLRGKMERVNAAEGAWAGLDNPQKLAALEDNLDVEIDAQRQILRQLEGSDDPTALTQSRQAMDELKTLEWKRDQVRASRDGGEGDLSWWDPSSAPTFRSNADVTPRELTADVKKILEAQNEGNVATTAQGLRDAGYSVGTEGNPPSRITSVARKDKSEMAKLSVRNGRVVPGLEDGRVSYKDRYESAGKDFEDQRAQDAQLRENQTQGPLVREDAKNLRGASWRDDLATMVDDGTLTANDAGMLQKWGRVVGELRAAGVTTLPAVTKNMTSGQNDAFRHQLRELALDAVEGQTDGAARKAMMMRFMDAQPENGSKGAFFEHVMNRKLVGGVGSGNHGTEVLEGEALARARESALKAHPEPFEVVGAQPARKRFPDGDMDLSDMDSLGMSMAEQTAFDGLPSRVLLEHKASASAVKLQQAVDYMQQGTTVYFLPTKTEANAVLSSLESKIGKGDELAAQVLGGFRNEKLVLMYLDESNMAVRVGL